MSFNSRSTALGTLKSKLQGGRLVEHVEIDLLSDELESPKEFATTEVVNKVREKVSVVVTIAAPSSDEGSI